MILYLPLHPFVMHWPIVAYHGVPTTYVIVIYVLLQKKTISYICRPKTWNKLNELIHQTSHWSPFKLKSFQAQQCGLVEPVINGVITPKNGLTNEYLVTHNPYCNVWNRAKKTPLFCASELLPLGRWKHCFRLLRSPCGDRTSTTPRCLNFGLKGWCVNNKGVWERFIWWIPPALPACLVKWGLMTDCLSVLCFCLYNLS